MAVAGTPSEVEKDTKNFVDYINSLVSGGSGGTSMDPAQVDLIVYRVKKSDDKDDVDGRYSLLSEDSGRSTRTSKTSQGSRQSGKGSASSTRGFANLFERSTFTVTEWLLLSAEMFISFAWFVIRERRREDDDLVKKAWTDRMELMDVYLKRALSGMGAMVAGYIADTYVGIYPVALANVVLHFAVSSILLMEEIIKRNDYDQYHAIVWQTVGWSFIPIKATDFARMVFGLEQMGRKNTKASFLFIFLSVWLNERSCGGILLLAVGVLQLSRRSSVQISFVVSGLASALYVYNFRPDPNKITSISGIGNKIVGCIVTALWTKWRVRGRVKNKVWIEMALVKYDKLYVHKTKQLLRLYIMITPAVGLLFFITSRSDFYVPLWHRMRPDGFFYYTGVINGARIITLVVMAVVALGLLPLILRLKGMKRNFLRRLVIGYLSALMCYFYSAVILANTEGLQPSLNLGLVRIVNVGQVPIRIASREDELLHFNHIIEQESGIVLAVDVKVKTLFKMMFQFGNQTNFTTMISVTPNEVQGYVALYPPEIVKIAGFIPIWHSPPGYNIPYMARLYIANMIRKTNVTVLFVPLKSDPDSGFHHETDVSYHTSVNEGYSTNLQVPNGTYLVQILEADLTGYKIVSVGPGGVYTIILFSTRSSHEIHQDTMVKENYVSAYLTFGISVPYALTLVFAYVSLRAFLHVNTPEGLEGMCFGYLETIENSTAWALWIGFLTWHPFVTALTITIYSIVLTLLFFFCLFVSIKYNEYYRW